MDELHKDCVEVFTRKEMLAPVFRYSPKYLQAERENLAKRFVAFRILLETESEYTPEERDLIVSLGSGMASLDSVEYDAEEVADYKNHKLDLHDGRIMELANEMNRITKALNA